MPLLYATPVEPLPRAVPEELGTLVPPVSEQVPGLLVKYLNHPVVAYPFGFPVPFKVAVVWVTLDAASVVTLGAP
jgi:hypothetical protein